MKNVGAVIVTHNNVRMLQALLKELEGQVLSLNEIVVIDNASIDTTQGMIQENYPRLLYIRLESNRGSAGGYYEGIRGS